MSNKKEKQFISGINYEEILKYINFEILPKFNNLISTLNNYDFKIPLKYQEKNWTEKSPEIRYPLISPEKMNHKINDLKNLDSKITLLDSKEEPNSDNILQKIKNQSDLQEIKESMSNIHRSYINPETDI